MYILIYFCGQLRVSIKKYFEIDHEVSRVRGDWDQSRPCHPHPPPAPGQNLLPLSSRNCPSRSSPWGSALRGAAAPCSPDFLSAVWRTYCSSSLVRLHPGQCTTYMSKVSIVPRDLKRTLSRSSLSLASPPLGPHLPIQWGMKSTPLFCPESSPVWLEGPSAGPYMQNLWHPSSLPHV